MRQTMHQVSSLRVRRGARGLGLGLVGIAGLLACGGDSTGPAPLTAATAYWTLAFNQHAVTLAKTAPYDTIQLTAVPLNALGQPLTGLGAVHYSTTDSMVTVDSTGLVTAKFVTQTNQRAKVVAKLTDPDQRVTLVDTCFVQVTATAPSAPLASFAIVPKAGSDTVMPVDQFYTMTATAQNASGGTVASFPYFTSSDPSIAQIDRLTGYIIAGRTGEVTLYATTWAYGVAKRDSTQFRVAVRSSAKIQVLPVVPTGSTHLVQTFWPQVITVSTGTIVKWINNSYTDSIDVVFDDPTNVDSAQFNNILVRFATGDGNIDAWVQDTTGSNPISARLCATALGGGTPPNCNTLFVRNFGAQRWRTFPIPGTYHYHSVIWGTSGTIVVQ